jgi:hypothetical protein
MTEGRGGGHQTSGGADASVRVESNYREVLKAIKAFSPQLEKRVRADLRVYAAEVAAAAKAGAHWSTKIPPTIRVSVTAKGVGVRVARGIGTLYELGNTGSRWEHESPAFRHPVFGSWGPFSGESRRTARRARRGGAVAEGDPRVQRTRPFLKPAIDRTRPAVIAKMNRAIEAAKKAAGF